LSFLQQLPELQLLITQDARVRGSPLKVFSAKVIDDVPIEISFKVKYVKRNIESLSHSSCILRLCHTAATVRVSFLVLGLALVGRPNSHGYANDIITILEQEMSRETAVNTPTHGNNDSFSMIYHRPRLLLSRFGREARFSWSVARVSN
jgi:hypothetical protein